MVLDGFITVAVKSAVKQPLQGLLIIILGMFLASFVVTFITLKIQ